MRKIILSVFFIVLTAVLATSQPATAQQVAEPQVAIPRATESGMLSLRADELIYNNDEAQITANGNVILEYQGRRVSASKVIYHQITRRVQAMGNVEMIDENGDRLVTDSLDLTDDFSDGFISALEVETKDETYFSATSAEQLDGAMVFHNGVYTPCARCNHRPVTWQVKAEKIIFNAVEKTITYENAGLEFFGVPLFTIANFTHADPSVTRKDGFLIPDIQFSDDLGTSYHQSYFKTLGDNMDAKFSLTSYSQQGFLARVDWRRQFATGGVSASMAAINQQEANQFDNDSVDINQKSRVMFGTKGEFNFTQKWTTGWDLLFQSDASFANTYNLTDYSQSNITNEIYLQGIGEKSLFSIATYDYDIQSSLSEYRIESQQAFVHPVVDYQRIFSPENIGGDVTLDVNITSISREELSEYTDGNNNSENRTHGIAGNVSRISANLEWRRQALFSGFSFATNLGIYGDGITTNNEGEDIKNLKDSNSRFMPKAALEFSYPLLVSAESSSHIIEPMVQLIARSELNSSKLVANEDSQSLVFDATSLFVHDKFSGYDRIESGMRANYGFRYSGNFKNGLYVSGLLGQSYHIDGDNPFLREDLTNTGLNSGLETTRSDYVASVGLGAPNMGQFAVAPSLHLQGRFNEADLRAERMESSLQLNAARWDLGASYAFINAQPSSGFNTTREQLNASGELKLTENWSISAGTNYDIESNTFIRDVVSLRFDDSCLLFSITFSQTQNLYNDSQSDRSVAFKVNLRSLTAFEREN